MDTAPFRPIEIQTAQKMKFSIKDQIRSFLNGKLHFLCSIYITSIFSLVCINAVVLLIQEMIFQV